jgi:hypothetical protein
MIFFYPLYALASWILTLIAYLFAPIIVLFQKDGELILSWFGTPDAPAVGADFWERDNPTYSDYKLAVTWMWRNPAQGFDLFARAKITSNTSVTVRGNLDIKDTPPARGGWFLVTGGGYFQLSIIWPTRLACFVSHTGWNLEPIAKGYTHSTLGALKATPLRFYMGR